MEMVSLSEALLVFLGVWKANASRTFSSKGNLRVGRNVLPLGKAGMLF